MAGNSKGSHGVVGSEEIDRVSDLPDNVLHHLLSFLDSKSMVQSSVLSKRWRCLWKDVPAFNFCRSSFNDSPGFREHVSKLLSLRSESAAVCSVTFDFMQDLLVEMVDTDLFDSVMKYAALRGTDEHRLRRLSIHAYSDLRYSGLGGSIRAHGHGQSLRTLQLVGLNLQTCGTSGWGFDFVTNLELRDCHLCSSAASSEGEKEGKSIVPFPDFPRLNWLKIFDCTSAGGCIEVSGLQLLHLEIQQPNSCSEVEVLAPKLKSFLFWGYATCLVGLNLPSLDCANIRIRWVTHCDCSKTEEVNRACMKLLRGLHNVTSLNLRFDEVDFDKSGVQKHWERDQFPLDTMESLMESEASPFTRLKTLKVQYPQEPPPTADQVFRYFSDGSPEEKSITFKRIIE